MLQALPVQLPFHHYEDDVYKLVAGRTPEMSLTHVEPNARATLLLSPGATAASGAFSPTRSPQR